ncbi:hypothetical protein [Arthrobacter sp. KBS0702]|uniref:hypothetical protein n=1 Tax=Arthrobacter sp. KBS0702 TaxID=2578107 RepID=UPI0021BDC744|nr:hypothetical protein [Arthrobacter sp. KBS0702]
MGIYRAGFYTHDRVERAMFHARYVDGNHSATRIHPELQDLKVGDPVPYGGGVRATVSEIEPNRYLVAGEAFVLRPLPGNRTRLIIRWRGMGYLSAAAQGAAADAPALTKAVVFALHHVPGAMLLARGIDYFIADPLHHYMEVGVLRGVKQRAEGTYQGARDAGSASPGS